MFIPGLGSLGWVEDPPFIAFHFPKIEGARCQARPGGFVRVRVLSLTGRAASVFSGFGESAAEASRQQSQVGRDKDPWKTLWTLAHFGSCSTSDKEPYLSRLPAPPLPTCCLTQDSHPLSGSASPDTSKTFPPRGWGTPRTPCSIGGSASKTECHWGLAPLQRGLITLGVIPLRKGLLITEGRASPLKEGPYPPPSPALPHLSRPPPVPFVSAWLQEGAGEVGAGGGRARA